MQRCCHCHGRFGLVSHRYLFKRFCSKACIGSHKRKLATAIGKRISRLRSEFTMSFGFGHNRASVRAPGAVPVRVMAARSTANPRQADHFDHVNEQIIRRAPLLIALMGAMIALARLSAWMH